MAKRKKSKRARPLASFNRTSRSIPSQKCILIVTEGRETEPIYFSALKEKLGLYLVTVKGKGGTNLSVVEYAITLDDERRTESKNNTGYYAKPEYDKVWCVFDREQIYDNAFFDQAVRLAESKNMSLAVSNPAFEYWYLVHFVDTGRPFLNANEIITELKCYIPDYEKSRDVFDYLFDKTSKAILRAERVLANSPDSDKFPNPSTFVFKLVQSMIQTSTQNFIWS